MRIVSNKRLLEFAALYPEAGAPLQFWRRIAEAGSFNSYGDLKRTYGSVDRVRAFYVFNIGGNKFRLVAAIHFNRQIAFIRHVFTHREYDAWMP